MLWRIIGAVDVRTGAVHFLNDYLVGRRPVIQMHRLLAWRYRHKRQVCVVQDNWNVHQHPDVAEALAHAPRIERVWLPTYAPWLNPIEQWWGWLNEDLLQRDRFATDWNCVRQTVRDFLDPFHRGSPTLRHCIGLDRDGEGRLSALR
jgi:hypothetical protein